MRQRTSIIRLCEVCSTGFKTYPYRVIEGRGRFCSKSCQYKTYKGRRRSPGTEFKKGHGEIPARLVSLPRGSNHHLWKGNDVGMGALHKWVERNRGKPNQCEHCTTTDANRYEWANISGQYKRDLSDWVRLCKKCHIAFDDVLRKSWETRHAQLA